MNPLDATMRYEMVKIEQRHRLAKLEQRRRQASHPTTGEPADRPHAHAIRRATIALAGAGLALTAIAANLF